jgi:hypothetical protein
VDRTLSSAAVPRPTRDESSPPLRVGDTAHRSGLLARAGGSPTGMAVSAYGCFDAAGRSEPCGECLLTDSIETSQTDQITLIEDIAMTSAVLILALSGVGGHHGIWASGQCPPAPCKALPTPQAPAKCPPAPCKRMPCAPPKCLPSPQAPCKVYPAAQAPVKAAPQAYPQAAPQG